jgi:hypothetical protein
MTAIKSVFIVEPDDQGWIIERLMRDIAADLNARGISARIGNGGEYRGEEVIFNSRFLIALSDPRASVNSVFITHVDDKTKEFELRSTFARFNSFVCLSPHDAEFVIALRGDRRCVTGIELPAREVRVRPIRIVMFSARYEDGRKNEQWIIDYFRDKSPEQRGAFVFCFLGWGWESFCAELAALEMNYEIYRYSRYVPGEYELYKEILPSADALIYLGFDGGAMSVYDALNAGIDVLASDTSYHRGLGEGVKLFADRSQFHGELDRLFARHANRTAVLRQRSVGTYVQRLLAHWHEVRTGGLAVSGETTPDTSVPTADEHQTLREFRGNYKRLSFTRIRSALIRWLQNRLIRS